MHGVRGRRFRRAAVLFAALAGVCAYAFTATGGASASSGITLPKLGYPVTNFVKYVDGKAGAANPKLSPVLVGWSNNQGGSVLVGPTATNGAALAAEYINQHAGGIDGHPIKLVYCEVPNTEAEGTACGDTFAATKGLEAIGFGGLAVGSAQEEAVVSPKIPIVIGVSTNPSDDTNPNTYIFGGASQYISYPWATFSDLVQHAKTVSLLFPDEAGYTGPASEAAQAYGDDGIKATEVGLDPDATDYVGALEAANVSSADAIYVNGTPATCVEIADALKTLNVSGNKVVSSPLCLAAAVKSALGNFPEWYYGTAQDNLVAGRSEVKAYYKVLGEYGLSASDEDPWFCTAFSEIMTVAQMMNAVAKEEGFAKLTPKAVNSALKKWRGPFIQGQPNMDCGEYAKAPASCADQTIFVHYNGTGFTVASVTKSSPTGWMLPPKVLQPGG